MKGEPWRPSYRPIKSIMSRESGHHGPDTRRWDVMKGNDYVRVWIKKGADSDLIYVPTATSSAYLERLRD